MYLLILLKKIAKNTYYLILGVYGRILGVLTKPVIYEVFISFDRKSVCLIAPHYSVPRFLSSSCIFDGGEIIKGEIVKDKEKATLVVLYKIPEKILLNKTECVIKIRDVFKRIVADKCLSLKKEETKYNLSITTLFKYDHPYMTEWIEHHLKVGVEHFYLYDNNEKKDMRALEILKPYIDSGKVTYIRWDYPYKLYLYYLKPFWPRNAHFYTQLPQINHAIYKYGHENKFILASDMDEFFYSKLQKNIVEILEKNDTEGIAAFSISGQWFGSSGFKILPQNAKVLETYTRSESTPTCHPKCVLKPKLINITSVHNVSSADGKVDDLSPSELIFNHYRMLTLNLRKYSDTIANEVENKAILKI